MKKKKIAIFLAAAFMFAGTVPAVTASAYTETPEMCAEEIVSETVEYFEDGSYLTITVTQEVGGITRASVYEQSGSKYQILRNKDGEELWRFTVHGTFSVNPGVSATCTKASYSSSITESAWELSYASAYASENQAIGNATFVKKQNGKVVETKYSHVGLTCDENGKLS